MADGIMNEEPSEVREYLSEEDEKLEDSDSHPLGNPAPPPDVDLEMLRGDRIGDTVYSGKWCIEIVMKLMQSNVVLKDNVATEESSGADDKADVVDMEEDLQNEVGVLWDMTSNEEVCEYLHSVGAIESICHVISNSRCPRATEMCVGMLANVVTHDNMWKILGSDSTLYNSLIPLLANTDQPSLLEVTRFFNTCLSHADHDHCYSCLCQWEGLVTQEITRILSGSTHSELLRQSAELSYNLLYLDTTERHFCASLANSDFVLALVEASREIGYEQVTGGQNHVMDVLYHLTTYTAGALAMENCLEPVSCAVMTYLKALCRDLRLSNDCATITTLLATLDHIYCRHTAIQQAILSSPRMVRYVLKVLVTVYRRLGQYHLISSSHRTTEMSGDRKEEEASSWGEMDDTPKQRAAEDGGSWSERAAGVTSTLRTPEASPVVGRRGKELDVSWSERRVGTPLAEELVQEVWKRPRELKRVSRRKEGRGRDDASGGEVCCADSEMIDGSEEAEGDVSLKRLQPDETTSDNEPGEQKNSVWSGADESARRINYQERFDGGDQRKSEGFSPHPENDEQLLTKNKNDDDRVEKFEDKNDSFETTASVQKLEISNDSSVVGETETTETLPSVVRVTNSSHRDVSSSKFESDDEDNNDGEEDDDNDGERKGDNFEEAAAAKENVTTAREDKYQNLLSAIRELFTDVIASLAQSDVTEAQSTPRREMLKYLDRRCSSTELQALVRCVGAWPGNGQSGGQALGRLLDVCERYKVRRLGTVVGGWVGEDGEGDVTR
ncbi:uncharacterized protein LOC101850374 [Aplysia californica]|uniref:Uncharacterized protein LOC101850374 n=1 Tax=Aplysia californica TaxID=6500 RepID=A0ABM1AC99_APLCA|nr:uncharacterized protein LOC101850374 [Aplysia californica]